MENSFPCACGHEFKIHSTLVDNANPHFQWFTCLYFSETDTGHSNRCKCEEYKPDNLKFLEKQYESNIK